MRHATTLAACCAALVLTSACGGGSTDAAPTTWYKDADGDRYSDGTTRSAVEQPAGYFAAADLLALSGDCDDGDLAVFPGAAEACNGKDDDCDGQVDGGLSPPAALRQDGVCAGATQVCAGALGWVEPDYDLRAGFEATEATCDGLDNDCDGGRDESCTAGFCTVCHAAPMDDGDGTPALGRRAAAAEFPVAGSHGHFGAVLDAASCLVCHDASAHGGGTVTLRDPDGGAGYGFVLASELSSDPDLSTFCMACHDADGAQGLAAPDDPFGRGAAPANVAARFAGTLQWNERYGDMCFGDEGTGRGVNSHHDVSDADQAFSGAKLECLDCHGAHAASVEQPLVDPFARGNPWTGTGNAFCLTCHAGGTPAAPGMPPGVVVPTAVPVYANPPDPVVALRPLSSCDYTTTPWYSSYTWGHSSHGPSSKRGWAGYSGAPAAELRCLDCHDAHGSATATNAAGNPYLIRDQVDGTGFVDDGNRKAGWTGPPWTTFGTAQAVVVPVDGPTVGWGNLCVTCHAGWRTAFDWHDFCAGCQTCHGHGQDWNEGDHGPAPDDSVSCFKCGNGVIDPLEQCDDGNLTDGDGCSNECTIE